MRFVVAVVVLVITATILLTSCEVESAGPDSDPVPAICQLPKIKGPCRALFRRYYYNSTTNNCTQFVYGGCGGNENNFPTEDKCQQTCQVPAICQLPKIKGPCRALFRPYYYNSTTNNCTQFVYGGCGGNENNFPTEDKCQQTCQVPAICQLPKIKGPCRARFRRYYYNSTTNNCTEFVYGGCGGNENNFPTEDKCQQACQG
ncbi:carboxypeptidase inhibitor SmCI isoform X2 [Patella vulgata]|uniref:carboxypeptidase inhibitor SmCI isoform X2 n=1 Tax=Patella vulgata TaxID=6465 RepID=UPI00217F6637|nr:carboxypeptidase inhibitor SmCI isoform X2 [Patella vulgata]